MSSKKCQLLQEFDIKFDWAFKFNGSIKELLDVEYLENAKKKSFFVYYLYYSTRKSGSLQGIASLGVSSSFFL